MRQSELPPNQLVDELSGQFARTYLEETITELLQVRALGIAGVNEAPPPRQMPPVAFKSKPRSPAVS